MSYLITCPFCKNQIHLKAAEKYDGKKVRFRCKNEDCAKINIHKVELFSDSQTRIVHDEDIGTKAKLTIAKSKYNKAASIVLTLGEQIVGRKSSNKQIDFGIISSDVHLSRKHCLITGYQSKKGGALLFTIQDYQSKNGVIVNNKKLEEDSIFYLSNGDSIQLGSTIMTFNYF